jgi:glycopeptide antibiotics resistance protein
MQRSKSGFVSGVVALLSVGAGLYLLASETEAGNSVFDIFLNGIGVYFIAKGIFMARALWEHSAQNQRLDRLIELAAIEHTERTTKHTG